MQFVTLDMCCVISFPSLRISLSSSCLMSKPAQIVKLIYYKQSESIRYQLCCKEGVLKGTYGRNELNEQAHLNPELMGINYQKMKVKDTITPSEAHEKYLGIGGKTRVADVGQTAANQRAVNAGSMVSYATSTVIKREENLLCKLCVVSD